MTKRLEAFARRLEDDAFFLGSALADYARSEDLDDLGLARSLGCSVERLLLLRLCRRPHPESTRFRQDIDRIAVRYSINTEILAEVVRRSNALAAMKQQPDTEERLLMAARDHEAAGAAPHDEKEGRT